MSAELSLLLAFVLCLTPLIFSMIYILSLSWDLLDYTGERRISPGEYILALINVPIMVFIFGADLFAFLCFLGRSIGIHTPEFIFAALVAGFCLSTVCILLAILIGFLIQVIYLKLRKPGRRLSDAEIMEKLKGETK